MSDLPRKPKKARAAASTENTATTLHEERVLSPPLSDDDARATLNRRARRSFLVAAAALVGGLGLRWLLDPTRRGIFDRMLASMNSSAADFSTSTPLRPNSRGARPGRLASTAPRA